MINYKQPLMLTPNRVWRTYNGGKNLDIIEGKDDPGDGHFPEDWVGSATRAINAGRENIVEGIGNACAADGSIVSIDDLISADPIKLLGQKHVEAFGRQPQLLVKYLDSTERLQIQAHPTVEWAGKHLNSPNGKTEAWWFLNARNKEDSYVLLGFQNPPSPDEWGRILREQDKEAMMACFEKVPVKPGDVLLVEGGIPHAIGPGLHMIEIMEPTDLVVRCEFAHGGLVNDPASQCMGMEIENILDMFDYTAVPADKVPDRFGPDPVDIKRDQTGSEIQLIGRPRTDRLELRRVEINGSFELETDERFSILLVTNGNGTLTANGAEFRLNQWDRILLPSACKGVTLTGQMETARCMPPFPGS